MFFSGFIKAIKDGRLLSWLVSALALLTLITLISPHQLPIVVYKLALVSIAAIVGYHLDRALFPYSSPGGYLKRNWKNKYRLTPRGDNEPEYAVCDGYLMVFALVVLRRAVIVGAVMLGVTLGI
ncbi:putative holin [Pasteurella multocida]|nr:putative holin [Pasteurella multocida]